MNRSAVMRILAIYSAAYPMAELNEEMIELWVMMLQDITLQQAEDNIKEHIRTNKFPPTIADILKVQSGNAEQLLLHTSERMGQLDDWEREAIDCPAHILDRWGGYDIGD